MSAPYRPTGVPRIVAFAVPVLLATWLIGLQTFMGTANFVMAAVLFTALGWVAVATYRNGLPASSLAQSLHDADQSSRDGRRQGRGRP